MKHVTITILFALLFSACKSGDHSAKGGHKYEKENIVFDIPEGWEITDEQKDEDSTTTFSCEKEGFNESGFFSFSYLKGDIDPGDLLDVGTETYNRNSEAEGSKLQWKDNVENVRLNDFDAQQRRFTLTKLGISFSGYMTAFKGCGITVLMLYLEADEDHAKNVPGHNVVTGSISCK